jgi:hypothetical protein
MEGEKSRVIECTTTNFNGCAVTPPSPLAACAAAPTLTPPGTHCTG